MTPSRPDTIESPLPDISQIDLAQLRTETSEVLAAAIRRVREQATDNPVVAGFQSSL